MLAPKFSHGGEKVSQNFASEILTHIFTFLEIDPPVVYLQLKFYVSFAMADQ